MARMILEGSSDHIEGLLHAKGKKVIDSEVDEQSIIAFFTRITKMWLIISHFLNYIEKKTRYQPILIDD